MESKKQQSCGRDMDGKERSEQHRSDKNKVKHDERENCDTLRDREKGEMGPDRRRGLSTDLPASNPDACGHYHSTGTHTHRCTVITHQHWPSVV